MHDYLPLFTLFQGLTINLQKFFVLSFLRRALENLCHSDRWTCYK